MLLIRVFLGLLVISCPFQLLHAQTTQPEDLIAVLIPDNGTLVQESELPATFYCLIVDQSGENFTSEWYINDIPYSDFTGLAEFSVLIPEGEDTNLTIISLEFLSQASLIELSCRTALFPNVTYGYYQIGNQVVVGFDQPVVNGSEGNVAVLCVSALFSSNQSNFNTSEELFTLNLSVVGQGSADASDYGPIPPNVRFSLGSLRRCIRISITNDSILEGTETFTVELSHGNNTRGTIHNNAILIPSETNRTVVQITDACYNGEIRLRGGYDENQGRVEICYNGVWGTVCDNGQLAQVVCKQLGLEFQDSLEFRDAIFGPADYPTPILLDQVVCVGNETEILDCSHGPVGVHNCRHSQDISVDCLGRSTVGVPCPTPGSIRLVGGVDQYQGRVEVCTSASVYSTVCSEGWDNLDAQVVCRQLGFTASAAVAAYDALFGLGVGTIEISNVSCLGNESDLLRCTNASRHCTHFRDAGVDCLGRPTPGSVIIGFERTLQDNGNSLAVVEGETLELCVIVMSGSLSFQTVIQISTPNANQRAFVVQAPLETEAYHGIYLDSNTTRACFNISAVDDNDRSDFPTLSETVTVRIDGFETPHIRALPSAQSLIVKILDNDFTCSGGGQLCVDRLRATSRCITRSNVCNGFPDCSDGSDESNCTDYCSEAGIEGFSCIQERLCVPREHVCDGVPDCSFFSIIVTDESSDISGCTDGCIHGDVRSPLLGGASENEGIVEVCANGTFLTVSLDDGRFSVKEATVICRHLGRGSAGIPLSGGMIGINVIAFRHARLRCEGGERNVSSCAITIDGGALGVSQQARVRCFQQDDVPCRDGEIRLSPDGPSRNEGRVEMCYQNIWGAVYDRLWTTLDAAVICAQLNFSRSGALPFTGVLYGSVDQVPVVYATPSCIGNESSLLDCRRGENGLPAPLGQTGLYQDQADSVQNYVGVKCDAYPSEGCSYLDARLSFRRANSIGYLEICDDEGQWSFVCADNTISTRTAMVVCRQLGFDPTLVRRVRASTSVLPPPSEERLFSFDLTSNGFSCSGNEMNLTSCVVEQETDNAENRKRRNLLHNAIDPSDSLSGCNSLTEIQCGVPPRVTFSPPSANGVYEGEVGRRFSLSCSWSRDTYPLPSTFINSTRRLKRGVTVSEAQTTINVLSSQNLTLEDGGIYSCGGIYASELSFGASVTVNVRGPVGINQSAYLRFSFKSVQRLNISGLLSISTEELVNNVMVLIFESLPEGLPGVHVVDYCRLVSRRAFDIRRKLDRIECRVTQYSYEGEEVENIVRIVEHVGLLLPRMLSIFQDPVNISATGFCDAEMISMESGVTLYWQETLGGSTSTSTCPLSNETMATRTCAVGGVWMPFDENSCSSFSGQLNDLVDLFSNLTTDTYETAASRLSDVIELSEGNEDEQTSESLNIVADYAAELAMFVDESEVIINNTVVQDVMEVVGSLLQWRPMNVDINSSSSVLQSFEEIVSQYAQQLSLNTNETISVPSLTIVAELRSVTNFIQEGRTFKISGNDTALDQTMPGQFSSQDDVAVRLPPSLFERLRRRANVGVFFGRYEAATLFPVRGEPVNSESSRRERVVCSNVVAATVGENMRLQNLEQPVTLALRLQNKSRFMEPGSESCVSWDFNQQNWTTEGCLTSIGQGGMVTCHCTHLTNFAVLGTVCSREEDCQAVTRTCRAESIPSETGTNYTWPETSVGQVATFMCPNSTVSVTRRCSDGGVWQMFNESSCGVVSGQLNRLSDSFNNLTAEGFEATVSMFTRIVEQTEGSEVEQNQMVLTTVASYLTDIATFVADTNVTINSTVVGNMTQVVSSLLQWNPQNIVVQSSSRIIQSFEVVVYLFAQQLSVNETQNFALPSLIVVAELRDVESLSFGGRSFAIGNGQAVLDDEDRVMAGELSPSQVAAISLPASLFGSISDREDVGIFFALYDSPILFPVDTRGSMFDSNPARQTQVGSYVLAATVGPGLDFPKLADNVTVVFRLITENFTAPGSESCVSWNFTLQNWTSEGCTSNVSQDGIVTCSCNHLTNFAVLVDICSRQEDCQPLNPVIKDLLTFVSYIGMSISIVALVLTIITLLYFKKLRQKDTSKYHVQLSLAMLFMLIVSLALVSLSVANVTEPYGGCVTVSILVHYFTLVAVMWMGAEALLMFQKLVIIFTRVTTKFMVGISVLCWGVPVGFVLIPLIAELANGNDPSRDIIVHRSNSTEDISFCFLSHPGAFWGAFLVPIFAVMIFNMVVFIWVIVILVRHTKGTAARKKETVSNKTIIRLMISISGVMFLFGLTWLFAILTFSVTGLRETFQILFTVFNSFQGFFIFIFFCVFNKEALESWKEFLSCGKYQSKLLHPSHVKMSSSAVTKKAKQTASGSTGVALSSTTIKKDASEITKSDYDSSTITKSNIYVENISVETKVDLSSDTTADKATETTKEGQSLEQTASPSPAPAPIIVVETTDSPAEDRDPGESDSSTKKKEEKKNRFASLKARIKRYSTRKSKHHIEEVEVDFQSEGSGSDGVDEEVGSTTQL